MLAIPFFVQRGRTLFFFFILLLLFIDCLVQLVSGTEQGSNNQINPREPLAPKPRKAASGLTQNRISKDWFEIIFLATQGDCC